LQHFFQISRVSENQVADSFSMQRTYKIPDLYLFPPGGDEDQ
jgi:competence protein ComFB